MSQRGNRRHRRAVQGLRGEPRKVRDRKRAWSVERADREMCQLPRPGCECPQCDADA